MSLIDKYIVEIGKHLPRKQRADIEAEIRSTLEDMLDERKQAQDTVDEATVIELLKEYGAPREVAESYIGPRYLIGPQLYPLFEMVTRIVVIVLFAIALAGLGIGLANSSLVGLEFLEKVGGTVLELFGGLITAFGNIVLVFAILERTLPAKEFKKETEEWDPAQLASEPDPDQVKFGDQIFNILFMAGFLIIFNLYPRLVGFGFFNENDWVFISPVLTDAFFNYLPWINILALLEISLSVYLLRQTLWNTMTRIIKIVLELAWIALAVVMLKGPDLVALTPEQFANTPLADAAPVFSTIGNLIPTLVLSIVIIVSSIEVAQMAYHLLKSRPTNPYPITK